MAYLVNIKFKTFDNNSHFITLDTDEIYFNEKRDILALYNINRLKGSTSYSQFLNSSDCLKIIKMQGNYIEINLNKVLVDIEVKEEITSMDIPEEIEKEFEY